MGALTDDQGEMKGIGKYSQYTLADERISFPVAGISREHASTVPLAAAAVWPFLASRKPVSGYMRSSKDENAVDKIMGVAPTLQYVFDTIGNETSSSTASHALTEAGCLCTASKEDHELSAELFEKLPSWLESRLLNPSHLKLFKGLDSVPQGFQEHQDGKISAYKVVYEV
ncbi:hypothetical protein N7492_007291 [Penicillium capsulatum]|uniref:Uncharacterized protein n=1 Tax=Penicillium capsulatum TaxID=69766 RepID=A0A9W9LLJ5_9EURO|nr:hypothetical protein N7492_007291 [Penicillium capsulatum]KAJ6117131.1 hypothetical protein N7512_006856 [Penicillium capsulatum]